MSVNNLLVFTKIGSKSVQFHGVSTRVEMKYTPLPFAVNLRPEGFLVDVDSLFAALARLQDHRDARGLRYEEAVALILRSPAPR